MDAGRRVGPRARPHREADGSRGRTARPWVSLAVLAAFAVGCGQFGSATTRIDAGEEELEGLVADVVEAVSLEVTTERPFGNRGSCTLVNNRPGASNRLSLTGPLPEIDDVLGRSAALLGAAGYELGQGSRNGEVFARRDGLRITVVEDLPTGQLAIDAATGCRALPD